MYLGKYPDTPGALPPGYHGTAYTPVQEECGSCPPPDPCEPPDPAPCECCPPEPPCECRPSEPPCECRPSEPPCECTVCDEQSSPHTGARGLFNHIFSHKIDMEDLLLLALVVMMISSGADSDIIIMLALLFVLGV